MAEEKTHQLKIGVMGSASGPQIEHKHARAMARKLGQEIGKRGHIFINGACPGLPNDALLGAKEAGGFTVGVSPAFSKHAHIHEYKSQHSHDMILFTGMGFMERDIINIRSSDALVIVLTGTGGISDSIPYVIEDLCQRKVAPNMVFDGDPVILMDKLEKAIEEYPLPIHEDGRVIDENKPEGRRERHELEGVLEEETRSAEPGSRG